MALFGIGAIGLLALVIASATIAIVLSGATEIGLIRYRVQAALEERLGPEFNVSVGRAIVQVDPTLGLVVDLGDIEIANGDSKAVISVPATRLAVDAMALFGLRLSVTRAEVAGPRILLTRTEGGNYGLRDMPVSAPETGGLRGTALGGTNGGYPEFTANVSGLDRLLGAAVANEKVRGLHFSVVDGAIELRDLATGSARTIGDIDLNAEIDDTTGDIKAELAAAGHAGPWTATFTRRTDSSTGERTLSASFSQLTLADVASLVGADSAPSSDIPLYGSANVVLASDGAIKDASARLDVGAGVFRLGDGEEAILLDEASIRARWDRAEAAIVVEPSSFHFGDTGGTVTGTVRDEGDGRYAFSFESRDADPRATRFRRSTAAGRAPRADR